MQDNDVVTLTEQNDASEIQDAVKEVTLSDTTAEPTPQPQEEYANVTEFVRAKLIEKRKAGENLTLKDRKIAICKEIQAEAQKRFGSCSYQLVLQEVPKAIKANISEANNTVTTEGNSIIKKPVQTVKRPERKIITEEKTDESANMTKKLSPQAKLELLAKMQQEGQNLEAMMIQFTLDDAAEFLSFLGCPKPKAKKLAALAQRIAYYNEIQRASGNADKTIEISERIMRYAIYLGIASTFLTPLVNKFFGQKKTDEPETSEKPLVEIRTK